MIHYSRTDISIHQASGMPAQRDLLMQAISKAPGA
jgi:hypothetical protein